MADSGEKRQTTGPNAAPKAQPGAGRSGRASRGKALGAALVGGLLLLVLVVVVPGEEKSDVGECRPLTVSGTAPDADLTEEFARYGNDNSRLDDWTGGDGSRSISLPDGRTLWLSADTFLDEVRDGRSRQDPVWVRNAALVMSPEGRLERTLLSGAPDAPDPQGGPNAFFPGLATADGREVWRWPAHGVVEPREPGSGEKVVRVVLWQRETGQAPWTFGMPRASEVATLSLPDLRLESIEPIDIPAQENPAERVLYGTSTLTEGRWTYVFGADERTALGQASEAHVARVQRGELADASAWRYWDGSGWQRRPARSKALLVGGSDSGRGATNTFTVARQGATWLLFTTDAGGPDGRGLTTVTSYWSCSPQGPWHGPEDALTPPLPPGAAGSRAIAYNPQAHMSFSGEEGDGDLLLGYDVNVPDEVAAVHQDVDLYRPRFVRLEMSGRRPGSRRVSGRRPPPDASR